jgi:hypothetical protein
MLRRAFFFRSDVRQALRYADGMSLPPKNLPPSNLPPLRTLFFEDLSVGMT